MRSTSSIEWHIGGVLPNLHTSEPIEKDGFVVTTSSDSRVTSLAEAHPLVHKYLRKFTNQYGTPVNPTVLLYYDPAGDSVDRDVLVAFRNSIAIACLLKAYRDAVKSRQMRTSVYSGTFAFYPIIPSFDYEYLTHAGIGIRGLDNRIDEFHGQTDPAVHRSRSAETPDTYILNVLLSRWSEWKKSGKCIHEGNQLFRSLQIAFSAMAEWSPNLESVFDYGVKLGLWVAALETLIHDGKHVSREMVVDEFNFEYFQQSGTTEKRYNSERKQDKRSLNLPSKLCDMLYQARDAAMHGNQIREKRPSSRSTTLNYRHFMSVRQYSLIVY